jgi:hypothetical protein
MRRRAFSALAGAMRCELKRHCYRMMGGVQDAEDCVQETLLRGWREFASLRDGAAGRPWLYSIATAFASTPCARAAGGKPCSAPASMRSSRGRGRGSNRGRAGFRRPALNAGDVGALIGLLQRDIVLTMPPWRRTFTGRDEVARFMTGVWPRYHGFRAVAVVANGQPAAAVYARRDDAPYLPHSLHVLAGSGQVGEVVLYTPPLGASLFAAFGLAPTGLMH